jgi:hypothetical protein
MSDPIKPPGSGPLPSPVERSSEVGEAGGPSEIVRKELDAPQKVEQQPPAGEVAVDPVEAIANELQTGAIDVETALDRLVERALNGAAVAGALSSEMRDELESLLRNALETDPALEALVRDLERTG